MSFLERRRTTTTDSAKEQREREEDRLIAEREGEWEYLARTGVLDALQTYNKDASFGIIGDPTVELTVGLQWEVATPTVVFDAPLQKDQVPEYEAGDDWDMAALRPTSSEPEQIRGKQLKLTVSRHPRGHGMPYKITVSDNLPEGLHLTVPGQTNEFHNYTPGKGQTIDGRNYGGTHDVIEHLPRFVSRRDREAPSLIEPFEPRNSLAFPEDLIKKQLKQKRA